MQKLRYYHLLTMAVFFMGSWSCSDKITEKYKVYEPVYMSYADLRKSVKVEENEPLSAPGKIYFKDKYIYINEQMKGVHVIDNTNPSHPLFKKFISIPGNIDIAIKGKYLYADSYVDLVVLDIENLDDIKETYRIQDIFPYTLPFYEGGLINGTIDRNQGVIVKWNESVVAEEVENNITTYPMYMEFGSLRDVSFTSNTSTTSTGNVSSVGVAGSMARFSINGNALYVINQGNLIIFDNTDMASPDKISDNYVGWDIETLFLNNKTLFIGSETGMYLYDVTDPFVISRLSVFQHVRSCDPVVVEGNTAFVTLRSGSVCGGNTDQLDVVNVENKAIPALIKSYPMTNPKGLGIDNGILFICDGPDGLKVYDASDVRKIDEHMISHFENIKAYDVIPNNGLLFMVGDQGFYQYDYTNLNDIKLLSLIPVDSN